VAVNIVLTVTLGIVLPFAQIGIALATSIAAGSTRCRSSSCCTGAAISPSTVRRGGACRASLLAALGMGVLLVIGEKLLAPLLAGSLLL